MKRTTSAAAFLILALAAASVAAAPVPPHGWPIDRAHSRVTFTVTKWGFAEVEGRFLDFAGNLLYDAAHPERSRVDWRVRIASVETGAAKRDEALQGPDYFDAAQHPEMRFVSERVRPLAAGQLEVQGSLTIRGRTRPLTLRVACGGTHVVPGEGTFEVFQTEFTVNRHDYGVVGGSVLGPAISRDVRIKIIGAVNHR
jgi:polyisoprenoid-binding protein YceI